MSRDQSLNWTVKDGMKDVLSMTCVILLSYIET